MKTKDTKINSEIPPETPKEDFNHWLLKHVFLIKSVVAAHRFAHILVDEHNVCSYFESTSTGKASEPLRQRIASIRKMDNKWPKFDNEGLEPFDQNWIQRDTKDECYLYYQNGTIRITKDEVEFLKSDKRKMIWESLIIPRDYKPSRNVHEIVRLAMLATVDYLKLQIGIGYLLHRHWSLTMTKIVWAVDHKPKSRHDGRRGKDFFTKLTSLCRKWVPVKWKKGSSFWTSNIHPDTAICHFEDVHNGLATDEEMKKSITGDLSIERKGENITTRKFTDKPKFSASSQSYPLDFMDTSIRGRIWLIEFTDYLQKHPPKKTLVHEDSDLSSFDAWMIECVQCYFKNADQLTGTPVLTPDQLEESLRVVYGSQIVDGVMKVKDEVKKHGFIRVKDIQEELEISYTDSKLISKFKECYERVTEKKLIRMKKKIGVEIVPIYVEK